MTTKEKILTVLHFLPLGVTLALIINSYISNNFIDTILVVLMLLGWLSTLIVGNIKLIKGFFSFIGKGWTLGWNIFPFLPVCFLTAALGAMGAIIIAIFCFMFVPAVITLRYYFKNR